MKEINYHQEAFDYFDTQRNERLVFDIDYGKVFYLFNEEEKKYYKSNKIVYSEYLALLSKKRISKKAFKNYTQTTQQTCIIPYNIAKILESVFDLTFLSIGNICEEKVYLSGYSWCNIMENIHNRENSIDRKIFDDTDVDIFLSDKSYKKLFSHFKQSIIEKKQELDQHKELFKGIDEKIGEIPFDLYVMYGDLHVHTPNDKEIYAHSVGNISISLYPEVFLNDENSPKTFYIKDSKNDIVYNIINNGESFDPFFVKNPFDFMHLECCTDGESVFYKESQRITFSNKVLIPNVNNVNTNFKLTLSRTLKYFKRGFKISDLMLDKLTSSAIVKNNENDLSEDKLPKGDEYRSEPSKNPSFGKTLVNNPFVRLIYSKQEIEEEESISLFPATRTHLGIPHEWVRRYLNKIKFKAL
jgi:hypothetical protein